MENFKSHKLRVYELRVESPASRTPAHETDATVAPFRAWRGSHLIHCEGTSRVLHSALKHAGWDYVDFWGNMQGGFCASTPGKKCGNGSNARLNQSRLAVH